jgi:hypothetical protein
MHPSLAYFNPTQVGGKKTFVYSLHLFLPHRIKAERGVREGSGAVIQREALGVEETLLTNEICLKYIKSRVEKCCMIFMTKEDMTDIFFFTK